jgi:hypothetical protein
MRHPAVNTFLWLAGAVALVAGVNYVQDVLLPAVWRTPFSVVVVLFGFAGLLWSWRAETLRKREAAKGHCARYGYGLTGNLSGVCPECGTTVSG